MSDTVKATFYAQLAPEFYSWAKNWEVISEVAGSDGFFLVYLEPGEVAEAHNVSEDYSKPEFRVLAARPKEKEQVH